MQYGFLIFNGLKQHRTILLVQWQTYDALYTISLSVKTSKSRQKAGKISITLQAIFLG